MAFNFKDAEANSYKYFSNSFANLIYKVELSNGRDISSRSGLIKGVFNRTAPELVETSDGVEHFTEQFLDVHNDHLEDIKMNLNNQDVLEIDKELYVIKAKNNIGDNAQRFYLEQ